MNEPTPTVIYSKDDYPQDFLRDQRVPVAPYELQREIDALRDREDQARVAFEHQEATIMGLQLQRDKLAADLNYISERGGDGALADQHEIEVLRGLARDLRAKLLWLIDSAPTEDEAATESREVLDRCVLLLDQECREEENRDDPREGQIPFPR